MKKILQKVWQSFYVAYPCEKDIEFSVLVASHKSSLVPIGLDYQT